MSEENREDNFLEFLILNGAVEIGGLTESGEFLYNFTPKMAEMFPDMIDIHKEHIEIAVLELWNLGFVDIRNSEDGDMRIRITEKALDPTEVAKLDKDFRFHLEEIKRISRLD